MKKHRDMKFDFSNVPHHRVEFTLPISVWADYVIQTEETHKDCCNGECSPEENLIKAFIVGVAVHRAHREATQRTEGSMPLEDALESGNIRNILRGLLDQSDTQEWIRTRIDELMEEYLSDAE